MKTHARLSRIPYVFLVILLLSGCKTPPENTSTSIVTAPPATQSPTAETASPTPSPTITHTPTRQPLPTLETEEARQRVADLLESNGGCQFPCWWGITPGESKWADAIYWLQPLATSDIDFYRGDAQNDNLSRYVVEFPGPNDQNDKIRIVFFVDNDGVIQLIKAPNRNSLSNLLENYGEPSQIWLSITPPFGPSDTETFTLAAFFNKGIIVTYDNSCAITTSTNIDYITICPNDIQNAISSLWLWPPSPLRTFDDIGKFGVIGPMPAPGRFKLLDEVSDLDANTFFITYIDPVTTQCIKSPLDFWK